GPWWEHWTKPGEDGEPPRWKRYGKYVALAAGVLGLVSLGWWGYAEWVPYLAPAKVSSADTLHVTAEDLVGEFLKDARAAGKKYGDRPLTLTGKVARLKTSKESTQVFLEGPPQAKGLKWGLTVTLETAAVEGLAAGQEITVLGTVEEFAPPKDLNVLCLKL